MPHKHTFKAIKNHMRYIKILLSFRKGKQLSKKILLKNKLITDCKNTEKILNGNGEFSKKYKNTFYLKLYAYFKRT